jgi:hypothetical protein
MSAKGSDIMTSGGECRRPARRRQHICARVFIRIGKMIASDSLRTASLSECTLDTVRVIPHRRKGNRDEVCPCRRCTRITVVHQGDRRAVPGVSPPGR